MVKLGSSLLIFAFVRRR